MGTFGASTAEQQVYDLVKARIMGLELKPGEYLNDREVAKELGVSRTPIRNAFRRLEYEGLLNSQSRRGWQVSPLLLDDIREIFDIKEALQGMLARQAAGSEDETLRAEMVAILVSIEQAHESQDWPAWGRAHARFHELIALMSEHPDGRTNAILSNLNDQWRRVRRRLYAIPGYRARETNEHLTIGRAILDGDGETAEALTRAHLKRVRGELLQVLGNLVLPFAASGL